MTTRKKPPAPPVEEWLTPAAAAEVLGVHPQTLRRDTEQGVISAHRLTVSGHRRYRRGDLERLREQ